VVLVPVVPLPPKRLRKRRKKRVCFNAGNLATEY
jgi:hypothetical protein